MARTLARIKGILRKEIRVGKITKECIESVEKDEKINLNLKIEKWQIFKTRGRQKEMMDR
jgi:hypothetical protein